MADLRPHAVYELYHDPENENRKVLVKVKGLAHSTEKLITYLFRCCVPLAFHQAKSNFKCHQTDSVLASTKN